MEEELPNDPKKYIYAYVEGGGIYITTARENKCGDGGICGAIPLPDGFDEVCENIFTFTTGSIKEAAKILEKMGLTYSEKLQKRVEDMYI